jgi:hypothetical protein
VDGSWQCELTLDPTTFQQTFNRSCQMCSPRSTCNFDRRNAFFRNLFSSLLCRSRKCAVRRRQWVFSHVSRSIRGRQSQFACLSVTTPQYLQNLVFYWYHEIQMILGLSRGSASRNAYQVVDWSDPRNSQCSSGCRCFWAALHNILYVQSGDYHGMQWERHSDAWGRRTSYARFRSHPEQGSKPLNLGCSKLGWAGSGWEEKNPFGWKALATRLSWLVGGKTTFHSWRIEVNSKP